MEIKTCEEYVVSRVMDLEEELDRANRGLNQYKEVYEKLNERFNQTIDTIRDVAKLESYTDCEGANHHIIEINVWSGHNSDKFNKLCKCLHLEDKDFEKDNA